MRVHGEVAPNGDAVEGAHAPITGEWANHGPATGRLSAANSNSTSALDSIVESQKHCPKTAKAEKRKAERWAVVWGSSRKQGNFGVTGALKLGCDG